MLFRECEPDNWNRAGRETKTPIEAGHRTVPRLKIVINESAVLLPAQGAR